VEVGREEAHPHGVWAIHWNSTTSDEIRPPWRKEGRWEFSHEWCETEKLHGPYEIHTRYVIPVLSHGQVCVYGRLQATAWVRSTPRVRYSIQWVPGRACMHAGRATADRLDWCPVDSTRQTSPSPHGCIMAPEHSSSTLRLARLEEGTHIQGQVKGLGVWHILRVVAVWL